MDYAEKQNYKENVLRGLQSSAEGDSLRGEYKDQALLTIRTDINKPVAIIGEKEIAKVVNKDSIEVLDVYVVEKGDRWSIDNDVSVIFKFDGGIGLLTSNHWADMTFGGSSYVIDVCLSDDIVLFYNNCLTDDLREAFVDISAEVLLLRS